jgi:PIN domain nuclease of toxin-antitoxin system
LLPALLLDTHVLVRALIEPKRLTKEQRRVLDSAILRGEPVALSAVSLMELAYLTGQGHLQITLENFFEELQSSPIYRLLPLDYEVAAEIPWLLGTLRDPVDTAIVATARVHRLRLLTSDQRIIDSKLVPVID